MLRIVDTLSKCMEIINGHRYRMMTMGSARYTLQLRDECTPLIAMSQITLYHNPRCSKSRAALALLKERGDDIRVIEYLKTPPDMSQIKHLAAQLGVSIHEMLRNNETVYRELKLGDATHSEDDLLRAIAKHPILLQRPIAVADKRAVIGRPPEKVLEL